jgi:hypothetical protein
MGWIVIALIILILVVPGWWLSGWRGREPWEKPRRARD